MHAQSCIYTSPLFSNNMEDFGGYDTELFVETVLDRYKCSVCTRVLQDPELTVCCGQHFCGTCLLQWFKSQRNKSCPNCRAEGSQFQHVENRSLKSEIKQLKIACSNKSSGCKWTGELGNLKDHLTSESSSGCNFAEIKCTNKCGAKVPRSKLSDHMNTECKNRQETCQYCSKQDTFAAISEHKKACPKFPLLCPNSCDSGTIFREMMDEHLKTCPLQKQSCPFDEAGCTVRGKQHEIEKHISSSQDQHVMMLMASHKKVQKELKETKQELTNMASTLKQEIESMQSLKRGLAFEVNAVLESSTPNERMGALRSIQSQLGEKELDSLDSLIFRVLDFSKHEQEGTTWYSAPFIIEGYKVCLAVHPKGIGSGQGNHASLSLILLDIVASSPDSERFTSALDEIRVMVPLFKQDSRKVHRVFLKEVKGSSPFDLSPLRAGEKMRMLGTLNEWIAHIVVKGELESQAFIMKIERKGDLDQALLANAMRANALRMAARDECRPS